MPLSSSDLEVIEAQTGGVATLENSRLEIHWEGAVATILLDDQAHTAHWIGLWQVNPQQGLLTKLVATMPSIFREAGYTYFTCKPLPHTKAIFLNVGFEEVGEKPDWLDSQWYANSGTPETEEVLIHPLDKPSRMDQYTSWKNGKRKEPSWRSHKD